MVVATSLTDYFRGTFEVGELVFIIIFYPLCGWVVGLVAWWDSERKYQDSAKVKLDATASTE